MKRIEHHHSEKESKFPFLEYIPNHLPNFVYKIQKFGKKGMLLFS